MTQIFNVEYKQNYFYLQEQKLNNLQPWYCINFDGDFFETLANTFKKQFQHVVTLNARDNLEEKIHAYFSTLPSAMNFVLCVSNQNPMSASALNLKNYSVIHQVFHFASFLQKTYGFGDHTPGNFFIVSENFDPILNGFSGLVRILTREWTNVKSNLLLFKEQEFFYTTPNIHILDNASKKASIKKDDVFLVTAGARGITAQCCLKLAKETGCSFLLLGRTSLNLGRFEKFLTIEDSHELMLAIRNALLETAEKVTPKDVQLIVKNIQAVRDIKNTLKEFKTFGSRVKYYACDITQKSALDAVIANYAETWGPITGIIHGAGNLLDKLIKDETESDIDAVLSPKVKGLFNLINSCFFIHVKRCIIFSSISSLYGNKGQSAYATANEILNQAAIKMNTLYPHCQTIALCWGAWELGMVDSRLKSVFEKRGISLLSIDEGTQLFWRALSVGQPCIILDKDANMQKRLQEHQKEMVLLNRPALEELSLSANISKYFGDDYHSMIAFNQRLRLPAPPFLFVSRIIKLTTEKKSGCVGEMWFEYDIPCDTLFQSKDRVHEFVLAESCHAVAVLAYKLLKEELIIAPSALRGSNGTIEFYGESPSPGQTIACHVRIEAILTIPAGKLLKQIFIASCNAVPIFKIESYAAVINPEKIHPAVLPPPANHLTRKTCESFTESHLKNFYHTWNICDASSEFLNGVKIYSAAEKNSFDVIVGKFDLSSDHWVFSAHFVNDPLFPASLMHFALFQLLAFYVANKKLCSASQHVQYARNIKTKRKLIHSLYPSNEKVYFHLEISETHMSRIIAKAFVYLDKILLAEYEDVGIEWQE